MSHQQPESHPQCINPDNIDFNANVSFQLSRELNLCIKLRMITQEEAQAIHYEWLVIEPVDETIATAAQAYLNEQA